MAESERLGQHFLAENQKIRVNLPDEQSCPSAAETAGFRSGAHQRNGKKDDEKLLTLLSV
jgi:hypothetical protein